MLIYWEAAVDYTEIYGSAGAVVASVWFWAPEGQDGSSFYKGSVNSCVQEALLICSLSSCNTVCSVNRGSCVSGFILLKLHVCLIRISFWPLFTEI